MRYFFAMTAPAAVALSMTLAAPAQAQTYPWCAELSGQDGATNCGFATWQQCQANISGVGGFCSPNPYYTSDPSQRRRR
jgi:hypothetical protein